MYLRARTVEAQQFLSPMSPATLWDRPTHFRWKTLWETDATSGYIVQEIYTVIHPSNCQGQALPTVWSRYWEAWQVTGQNAFSPNGFDFWTIQLGIGRRGTWSKTGVAYWVASLDPHANFRPNGVADAHDLLSTGTQPTNLGNALLRRGVQGEWEACNIHPALCSHRRRVEQAAGAGH
jgi:hypothetical protein